MNQQQVQQVADRLKNHTAIALFCGGEPTIDTLASALALALGLNQLGKTTQVITKNLPLAQHSRLVGVDKIQQELTGQKSFVISLPEAVDAIERVSCYAEGQNLNIVLQPYPDITNFNFDNAKYTKLGGNIEALVLVDVANMQEIASLLGDQNNALNQLPTIAIGKVTDQRIQNRVENPTTTASIVLKILQAAGSEITGDIAGNLMQGIYEATNDFHAPQLMPQVFEDAAVLLRIVHKSAGKAVLPVAPEPMKQPQVPQAFGRPPMPQGIMPHAPIPGQAGPMPQTPHYRPPMPPAMFSQPNPPIEPNMPRSQAQSFGGQYPQPPMPRPPMPKMSREWEIDDDFEFDHSLDKPGVFETPMGPGTQPPMPPVSQPPVRNQIAPMPANQPSRQPVQGNNQPKQDRNQNQQRPQVQQSQRNQNQQMPKAQSMPDKEQSPDGGYKKPQHKPNQPQNDNPQAQVAQPEEDWLSPKIYKTEDLL